MRRATPHDARVVAVLAQSHYGGDLARWLEQMAAGIRRSDALVLVAEVEGEVVGYGKAQHCRPIDAGDPAPDGYYLSGMVVAPAFRRRGIGTRLIAERTAWIWRRGEPAWFFANARNAESLRVHAALGFTEVLRAPLLLGESFVGGVGVLCRADRGAGPG